MSEKCWGSELELIVNREMSIKDLLMDLSFWNTISIYFGMYFFLSQDTIEGVSQKRHSDCETVKS